MLYGQDWIEYQHDRVQEGGYLPIAAIDTPIAASANIPTMTATRWNRLNVFLKMVIFLFPQAVSPSASSGGRSSPASRGA